jgi:hypothetical protein
MQRDPPASQQRAKRLEAHVGQLLRVADRQQETNQKWGQNNQGGVPVSTETVAATQETAMVF